jgi:hypothetical protein
MMSLRGVDCNAHLLVRVAVKEQARNATGLMPHWGPGITSHIQCKHCCDNVCHTMTALIWASVRSLF